MRRTNLPKRFASPDGVAVCWACYKPIPKGKRRDAVFCSNACRQRWHRGMSLHQRLLEGPAPAPDEDVPF